MIDYAFKNISKRWVRSLLTVVGVTVMMTLVVVITGIVTSQKQSMHQHAAAGAGKISLQPRLAGASYPAAGIDLSEADAEKLLALLADDIQRPLSGKVLYLPIAPPPYPNQPPDVILVGLEPGMEEGFTGSVANDITAVSGVETLIQDVSPRPLILGAHAAEQYQPESGGSLQSGDAVMILEQEFIVVGILDRSGDMVVNNALIVPLEQAQALVDKPGFVSAVIITEAHVGANEKIASQVREQFPHMHLVDESVTRRNLEDVIKLFENLINAIAVVVVAAATILIMTVTLITVRERTREIGVLRAIGASTGLVTLSIFWEVLMLSAAGSILGGIASGLILRFGMLENLFDLVHIAKFMPLAILLTLVSSILPAIKISQVRPVESLRYE